MEKIERHTSARNQKRSSLFGLRAKTPVVVRWIAAALAVATVIGIGIGFYRERNKKDFRMISGLTELSKDVTAVVHGYERRETEGERMKYYVKADKATTFADNHQELENAYFEIYDEAGEKFDKATAVKAVYVKGEGENFTAYFLGSVNIDTRNGLNVKSEVLIYDRATETVKTDEQIEFAKDNISGKSFGATVQIKEKILDLARDVEINSSGENSTSSTNFQTAKLTAGKARFDQNSGQVNLEQQVFISVVPKNNSVGEMSHPTDIRSEKAFASFDNGEIKKVDLNGYVEIFSKPAPADPKSLKAYSDNASAQFQKELQRIELNGNVRLESVNKDSSQPANIRSNIAVYDKPADRFELKNAVEIVTVADEKPTVAHASEAVYEQTNGKIFLTGGAEITQGGNYLKGDQMEAQLFPNKKLQTGYARGNAYLKQSANDRMTEVSAGELNAFFADNQLMQSANANGSAKVTITPSSQSQNYSNATVFAPQALRLSFRQTANQSVLKDIQTDGRTAIVMNPAVGNPNSTMRKITADSVKTFLADNGIDITKAEAVGNGEIYVEPVQATPENYKSTVTAERFDCEFYPGNNARICTGTGNTKSISAPMVGGNNRGERTLLADSLVTTFNQNNQNVEQFDAIENAKFTELDRTATARRITYSAADEVVKLRGGEPTAWDSQARAKAVEIDWDTKNKKSYLRGKVSSTYYSQKQTNRATPFSNSNAPVFITSGEAQFDHQTRVGVYAGNARAWQENNYVRADKLILQEASRRMDGEGNVQSLLYNVQRNDGKTESNQPAYAAAEKMSYTDQDKHLRYEGKVDVRQGTDRMSGGIADIFLNENNEAKQTVVQNNVVITQPNRRITGNWAQYTTADEIIILRGTPATVSDAQSGTSQGSEMTISLRDNKVTNQGGAKPNQPGRTRSVYKVNP